MNHFDIADWTDYARDLIQDDKRSEMEDHLASGCARCGRTLSALERVVTLARTDLQQPLPEHAMRAVKALSAIHLPERAPRLLSLALQLAFDSFLEPAPAGTRSLEISSRHLVYYAQNYALDLRLEYEADTEMLQLGGEILDRKFGPVSNVPAFLIADDQVVSRSTSGDLGEFNMACDNQGAIRLCLVMNDDECIDVSLDRRGRQPTDN
jgi:hypothetical protein